MLYLSATSTETNIHNNFITNNWTMGILVGYLLIATIPGNETTKSDTVGVNNNNISGNWFSQIEERADFAGVSPVFDFTNNWLGTRVTLRRWRQGFWRDRI